MKTGGAILRFVTPRLVSAPLGENRRVGLEPGRKIRTFLGIHAPRLAPVAGFGSGGGLSAELADPGGSRLPDSPSATGVARVASQEPNLAVRPPNRLAAGS